jgi:hypothetical protein
VTYDDLIEEYGSCTAAAKALELRRQTVHKWKTAGIPEDQQLSIQQRNPRLKADKAIVEKYRALLGKGERAAA